MVYISVNDISSKWYGSIHACIRYDFVSLKHKMNSKIRKISMSDNGLGAIFFFILSFRGVAPLLTTVNMGEDP